MDYLIYFFLFYLVLFQDCKIPWTEEPGRLQSTELQRIGHDWEMSTQKHLHDSNIKFCLFDCVDHNKLWKILKEMGIPDHLTCLLRNLYAGQEATVHTGHGTTDWFQIGKGVHQGCILSPCLFNLYAEYIIKTLGWRKHKLELRLPGEISITSDMQMTPPLWQKVKKN